MIPLKVCDNRFHTVHNIDMLIGDMHNRMGITPRRLIAALGDYDLWPVSS